MAPSSSSLRVMAVRETPEVHPALAVLQARSDVELKSFLSCQDALQHLDQIKPHAVVIDVSDRVPPGGVPAAIRLLEGLDTLGIACLILAKDESAIEGVAPEWVQRLSRSVSGDELWGRLASIQHTQQIVRRAQLELSHMQRLGRHLDRQFAEVDQDMRLASRLQREFLPQDIPGVENLSFGVLYRPAAWVSGDIYDIARVDEDHVCMYVADAVGHGMAASLMTMFVKKAIQSKEIGQGGYSILSPSETLQRLNDSIADQNLQNSQFVTALYGVLDHKNLVWRFARGGHPYPILVEPDGSLRELRSDGGLLGLYRGQEFLTKEISLKPGQKVIIYSDGMELAFIEKREGDTGEPRYRQEFRRVAHKSAKHFVNDLGALIEAEEGSLNPRDDITILIMEVLK